jgi:hypothetical protein
MKKLMNKKGSDQLMNQIVFIIIIIVFSVVMITFVTRFGTRAAIKEEIFSKQIALAIDKARAGTSFVMDISELYSTARKNKVTRDFVSIDNTNKRIIVHVSSGSGYSYYYFSDNLITWNIDESVSGEEKLIINVN